MDEVECVVVGAGVIGLAVARALALAGIEVLVLERAYTIGFETSSRNSEVIHGGLYYPVGSLKARSCVEGRHRLYSYCREHGVPHARMGKLIVATSEAEVAGLEGIAATARGNGVEDLEWRIQGRSSGSSPLCNCVAALLSPSTGIIDSHALMIAYQGEAEAAGATACSTPVLSASVRHNGFELAIGGAEPTGIRCRSLVNAAGLLCARSRSDDRGNTAGNDPAGLFLPRGLFRAERARAVSTADLPGPGGGRARRAHHAGSGRAGAVQPMWNGSPRSITRSTRRAVRYFMPLSAHTGPVCRMGRCNRVMPGIRPKISGPAEPAADFVVQGPETHGVPGLVNLYGIELPGLTASLPLADEVVRKLRFAES